MAMLASYGLWVEIPPAIYRSALFRGFEIRKGVGGRWLATNGGQNTARIDPLVFCSPSPKGGIGKRAQKRGLNLWHGKDLLIANPLCPPTPFRNFLFMGNPRKFSGECFWGLGIGNGVGKQGRGNQPPYRRYGPDADIQHRPREPHRLAKNKQNSLQRGSRYGISVSTPHRRYGHRLRTPFLRTPFPRLLWGTPRNKSAPESAREIGSAPGSAPESAFPCQRMRESTLGSLVALYRAMRLRFGYGFESCDANGPRNFKNTNIAKHRPIFLPPLLLVCSKELVLKVPKRGQFHAAIRATRKRCDSCAQVALGTRTVSQRNS